MPLRPSSVLSLRTRLATLFSSLSSHHLSRKLSTSYPSPPIDPTTFHPTQLFISGTASTNEGLVQVLSSVLGASAYLLPDLSHPVPDLIGDYAPLDGVPNGMNGNGKTRTEGRSSTKFGPGGLGTAYRAWWSYARFRNGVHKVGGFDEFLRGIISGNPRWSNGEEVANARDNPRGKPVLVATPDDDLFAYYGSSKSLFFPPVPHTKMPC